MLVKKVLKTARFPAAILAVVFSTLLFSCSPEDKSPSGNEEKSDELTAINLGEDFRLFTGRSRQLDVTPTPTGAEVPSVEWESSRPQFATVDENGLVTGVAAGRAIIYARVTDSDIEDDVQVTVEDPVLVTGVSITIPGVSGAGFALAEDAALQLSAKVAPENASIKDIEWSSDNQAVATVGVFGLVTGITRGTATIRAAAVDDPDQHAEVTVKVPDFDDVELTSVSITGDDFSLIAGLQRNLAITIVPSGSDLRNVKWSSSNENAATVSTSGQVRAVAAGTAVITAAPKYGSGSSGTVTVTVTAATNVPMTAQEIFDNLKGTKATTNGWADLYNDGAGLYYANPATLTLIDDATYPDPVAKRTAFTNAVASYDSKFVIVSGDIDLSDGRISDNDKSYFDQFNPNPPYRSINGDIDFNVRSNTTIIGIDNARFMFGGLTLRNGVENIIIRNVTFYDAHGSTANDTTKPGYEESKAGATALQIENNPGASGVWVDHCKFTDGTCVDLIRNYNHDGAFDIKFGRFITASWIEFTNHDKVMLVGSADTGYLTPTERQITLHHNHFHVTTQRMPRTRGTQMHVYNNYYRQIGILGNNGYCLGPGVGAQFLVENNFFDRNTFFSNNTKVVDYYDSAAYTAIVWSAGNNVEVLRSPLDSGASKPWEPLYIYTLDDNSVLPAAIPAGAGPTLVFMK